MSAARCSLSRVGRGHVRCRTEIEKQLPGKGVLRCEPTTSSKLLGLRLLTGSNRIRLERIVIAAEVMERTVFVAEDFERERSFAQILVVGFDSRNWLARVNLKSRLLESPGRQQLKLRGR